MSENNQRLFQKVSRMNLEDAMDGSGDRLMVCAPAMPVNNQKAESADLQRQETPNFQSETYPSGHLPCHSRSSQGTRDGSSSPSRHLRQGRPLQMVHPGTWLTKSYTYPLIYCSPEGTMSLMLRSQILVEMTVDRTIRAICPGKFAAASNARANSSCIVHPQARVYQEDAKVLASFSEEKQAVIGAEGIVFTMKALPHVYLVSSQKADGTLPFPKQAIRFPELPRDATLSLFYRSDYGSHLYNDCFKIVQKAQYDHCQDGTVQIHVNGVTIRQFPNDSVEIMVRPRFISLCPQNDTVSIRTHYVHMGVQEEEISFIKRGVKRVHVSPSGMVISDGNRTTSLDYMGHIVASS